jgi:hypothetical protein
MARLTVQQLRRMLLTLPDNAEVIFGPRDCCGGGWPEWLEATVKHDPEENRVMIELTVENPECHGHCDCTEVCATWCPIHGDCICEDQSDLNDEDCPLHSPSSEHAK